MVWSEYITLKSYHITSITFDRTGKILVSGSYYGGITLWDIKEGKELATIKDDNNTIYSFAHSNMITSLVFHPIENILASCSRDKTIKLWNLDKKEHIFTLRGHKSDIWSIDFHPAGKILASGSMETIKLWDIDKEIEITTLEGHKNWVNSVAFNPNGNILASGSSDDTIKLWDVDKGEEIITLLGHRDTVHSLYFNSDGKILASGSDNTIKLWGVDKGEELATLKNDSMTLSVAFHPTKNILVSGSSTGIIKLWNIEDDWNTDDEKNCTIVGEHDDSIHSVVFSSDGKILASSSVGSSFGNNTTILWKEIGKLTKRANNK